MQILDLVRPQRRVETLRVEIRRRRALDMILVIAVGDGLQRFRLDLDLPRAIDKYH